MGFDLFAQPELFGVLAAKIVRSYAMDALFARPSGATAVTGGVLLMLSAARRATPRRHAAPGGTGTALRWAEGAFAGAALTVDDNCVHLNGFNLEAAND